jgi:membrane protein implicated in regulation of membrane protease activity
MNQPRPPSSLLGKLVALVAGVILIFLGFMFSLVLLTVFVAVALMLGAWFFWKTRHVRKAMNSERGAGLREESAFFGRRFAAEDGIAMGEAAEAGDHLAVPQA